MRRSVHRSLWKDNFLIMGSTLLGLSLVAAFLLLFGISLVDIGRIVAEVPPWVFLVLAVTIGATVIAGSMKWQIAVRALSKESQDVPLSSAILATSFGVLLGQIMPIQIATATARAVVGIRENISAMSSVGSTIYEQLFEVLVLMAMVTISAAALLFRIHWSVLALAALLLITLLVVSTGVATSLAARALSVVVKGVPAFLKGPVLRTEEALAACSNLDQNIVARMTALSVLRYILMVAGAVVMAKALIPAADPLTIALAFPAVQIAVNVPVTPAGLGLVEVTWTGLFLAAGSIAKEAAIAAVAMRLMNFIGFCLFFVPFLLLCAVRFRKPFP